MFFAENISHSEAKRANEKVYGTKEPKPFWTHELIAGAAGFEAMKTFMNRLRETGEKPSISSMNEILADLAAVEVDKLIETKGLNKLDVLKTKRLAAQVAQKIANEKCPDFSGVQKECAEK